MQVLALSLCASHGRDTLYGVPPPGCLSPPGLARQAVASLAKEGARLRPKRQEQFTKLVPVCCANAEPASLAKVGARLRPKLQEQLTKLVPVCCANAGPACFA
jgi:hypothetical protein